MSSMRSKSSARKTTNLRPHPPGFVGRQEDLRRMHERFETGERLVSLVGSGGMGKTRLATHFGNERLSDYAGVWFADLTEAASLDDVCAAVARVLGVPLPGEGTTEQNLATAGEGVAARGRVLLILDNCEHVADAASAALEGWFSLAPEASFLVTSRERLRLSTEVAISIGPLQRDEAIELFVERARRIADDFQPGEADLATIGKIVEQLDRMPLAIELAASRTSVLAPQGLLERLAKRFDVLSGGPRGADKRHQTLRATIEWSWNLLDDWEPDALAQLSVFRGGFTLAAAEAVLDLSGHEAAPSALGVIQSLLDKSLLHANQEGRFGQYLSLREYAAEKLADSGQAEQVGERHASHYLAIGLNAAKAAVLRGEGTAIDTLLGDEDNLIAVVERGLAGDTPASLARAMQGLLALEPLRTTHGPFGPYRAQLDRALAAGVLAEVDASVRARAFMARGRIHGFGGRHKEAVTDLSTAVSLARGAKDQSTEGRALFRLGVMHSNQGDFDVCRAVYERALELLREIGDRLSEGQTLENLGIAYGEVGKFEEARQHFSAAREIYAEVGDHRRQAVSLANLGTLLQDEGKLDEARLHYERAITTFRDISDRRAYGFFIGHTGTLDQLEGAIDDARTRYEDAAATAREMGDAPFEAEHLGYLSTVLAARGDIERASELLDRAAELLAGAGDRGAATALRIHRGHIDLAMARRAETRDDRETAAQHRAQAQHCIDDLFEDDHVQEVATPLPHKARVAVSLLERAIEHEEPANAELPTDALVIGPEARWFCPPGGDPVDLFRRKTLRRLLQRLAEQHTSGADRGLTVDELLAAGWPGERVSREAGANRVRVALATLRKLGLKSYIHSRPDGYMLTPDLDLRDDARPSPPGE
jgi:predicted ATPase